MKTSTFIPLALVACLSACNSTEPYTQSSPMENVSDNEAQKIHNPLLSAFTAPHGIPPFDKIKDEHYQLGFEKAIAQQMAEIDAIAKATSLPSFKNTIEAMEKSGDLLDQNAAIFFALHSANTNEKMQALAKEVSPKLSKLTDDILLNDALFKRVKAVYQQKDKLELAANQLTLLEDTYKGFVRGGANLNDTQKTQLRALNEKLSKLSIQFGENLLAETNDFELVVDDINDLDGLPEDIIAAAAKTATTRDHEGKWVFTTHRPSKNPLLTYANKRSLREAIFKAYTQRGDNNNENDNKKIVSEIASLRYQKAALLGYKTHAHYVLENATAKTPENAYSLLNQVWPAALRQAKNEVKAMQELINKEGHDIKFEAWDWWYYAEKIRKARYDLDEAATKPYFSLKNTLAGVFYTAEQLWGVTFKQRFDLPKYHNDVSTFEVYDHDGSYVGIYLYDPYVRESKRGGAWMSSYRKQYRMYGEDVTPVIYNVTNFPEPIDGQPVLLTFSQANTLFHEFGHAIQGLLSDGYYRSQTGTALPRDYVEYPSQVMENWLLQPQVLAQFAKHYKTGEVIPQTMIDKIQAAAKFNQGFATTEYMAATLLDLQWHTLETADLQDANAFEAKALKEMALIDEIAPRYRSTYFAHIFSGGYSASYYGYIWSNIYDADTWTVFSDKGIFDQDTAKAYRKHVLEPGGSENPALMYKRFRGQDPSIEPLLERRGLK